MSAIPKDNPVYKDQTYWNDRFSTEDEYDWLIKFNNSFGELLISSGNLVPSHKILIVGCGNSSLSEGLYQLGFHQITNIDYSSVVIDKMSSKYPHMKWLTMDMRNLEFPAGSFDVVIDKAAMDALLVTQKDPWHPEDELKTEVGKYLDCVSRVLSPNGMYLQISFGQPHFRKMFLQDSNKYGWEFTYKTFGDGLGYFLYIMHKQ
jgi:ubiquinone/menaquinone biosynthesis C-methylase UbiE